MLAESDFIPMIGARFGHYRILDKIGEGGMGTVYSAQDEHLARNVAIKVMRASSSTDEASRRRFRNEAEALSKLNHPNIQVVYDFDSQDGVDFLAMEYIPGQTLAEKLASGPLPEKEISRLGAQFAAGLTAAHNRGILHRDLKPGNIRITPDGQLKILDFGLATFLRPANVEGTTESLLQTLAGAGTLPYMSPEQLRAEPPNLSGARTHHPQVSAKGSRRPLPIGWGSRGGLARLGRGAPSAFRARFAIPQAP